MILQKGASPDIKNKDGYLPMHVIQKESILQLLESASSLKKSVNDNKTKSTTRKNLKNNEDTSSSNLDSNSSIHRPNYSNPNRFQQLKQLAELSSHNQSGSNSNTKSNSSSSSKITNNNNKFNINGNTKPSTMKHKDEHYFKPGRVEQTKQKVLNDEEAELQKHLEHRRKDIALLAKRSAVKNNPFIKNESDSITKSIKRRQKFIPSPSPSSPSPSSPSPSSPSLSPTSHAKDLDGSNKVEQPSSSSIINAIKEEVEEGQEVEKDEVALEDDEDSINTKPKRNSKVINSLQTKSVVSSNVFLQTESPSLPKKQPSTTSLNKDITKAQKKYSITLNGKFEVTDPLSSSTTTTISSNSTPLNSPTLDRTSSSETAASLDSTQSSSSSSTNNNTNFIHSSIAIPKVNDRHEELSSKIEISSMEMALLQDIKSFEKNQPSSPLSSVIIDKNNLEQRRISGCQKSNWTKELQSLSPSNVDKKMNRKETQQNNDGIVGSLTISENNNLRHEKQKYFDSKYQFDDNDHLDRSFKYSFPTLSPSSSSSTHHFEYKQQIKKENDPSSISENTDFGNISSTTTSRYIRRLPTYDSIPYVKSKSTFLGDNKDEKNSNIIKESSDNNNNNKHDPDHSINKLNNPSVTSTLPNISKKQLNHHHPLVRSVSTFESTSSLTSFMNSSPFFSSSNKNSNNNLLNNHSLTSSSTLNNDHQLHQQPNGPGKLYVRVKGVNDVLLPIPNKDKAYVRCVINDGKYEYISGYELLSQQMTFGYECIIDCKPNMIITLSLHIRADYLLKKPLTKLLTTVQRKRKGSLSAFISSEDGSVGQTRFAVKDMLNACYRRSFTSQFHCFNAWYIPPSYSSVVSSPSSSLLPFASLNHHNNKKKSSSLNKNFNDDDDDSVLKVIGNFDVELLYLPISDPNAVIPKNLRECDMAIKLQQWNETCLDTEFVPKKIHRPQPRVS